MQDLQAILAMFGSIWGFFTQTQVPLLGISFADLWIGVFVINFSLTLLRPLLGIAGSGVRGIHIRHRPRSPYRSPSSSKGGENK